MPPSKYIKRPRVVMGHGDGRAARKAVDLAARPTHSHVEIHSIDPHALHFEAYARAKGLATVPANLKVRANTSHSELKGWASNSVDHHWSHFNSMSYYARNAFFREVFRTLRPGRKFVLVDSGLTATERTRELKKAGFQVTQKRLTPEEVIKLNTDSAESFASDPNTKEPFGPGVKFEDLPKSIRNKYKENWFNIMIQLEARRTPEVIASLKRMAEDVGKATSDKPFVRIIATKPRA